MKRKSLLVALAAFAMTSAAGLATATDRAGASAPSVSGVIIEIDRPTRTIVVAEKPGGRTYRLAIPNDTRIAISPTVSFGSSVDFERLIIGLQYRGVVVK
jgi:hypothetical protein